MFGVSIGPFFDISTAPLYVKEDRKTKFVLGNHELIIEKKSIHNCKAILILIIILSLIIKLFADK